MNFYERCYIASGTAFLILRVKKKHIFHITEYKVYLGSKIENRQTTLGFDMNIDCFIKHYAFFSSPTGNKTLIELLK